MAILNHPAHSSKKTASSRSGKPLLTFCRWIKGWSSAGIFLLAANAPAAPPIAVDLSKYICVGRYDLPEATRTVAPANSLLAQEASSVTYDWDTDTLFVVGDGGTSVVQVSKTGQLINSMTLAQGVGQQGTEFYDTEGITYAGHGKFVLIEERYRQVNLFTYVADGTLTRADVQTVKLGTTIGNIGLEGLSYDPQTGGFILVKEKDPQSIFSTTLDFDTGLASNGSATATSSTDLFSPALANLADFSDVFALSNLPSLNGQPDSTHLLVLSQESGQVIQVDRAGTVYSRLTIVADPGSTLTVPDMTMEGLTMDREGNLYIVNENGGGDANHPQLWVYAPTDAPNVVLTAVTLPNAVTSIPDNTSTAAPIKLANIAVADDGLGTNNLSLTGPDAGSFQIIGSALYLRSGTSLSATAKPNYQLTVNADDPTLGGSPDASVNFSLDVTVAPPGTATLIISEVAPWSSGNSLASLAVDWFEVTNIGTATADITGWKVDDSGPTLGTALALNGITSIAPGESVIFMETNALAAKKAAFLSLWFGANPPANLQIGNYTGAGIGLSSGGDALNLFDSTGTIRATVVFGSSPAGPVFSTFDNAVALNNATITTLSANGVSGAFVAASDPNEVGSPGTVGASSTPSVNIAAQDGSAAEAGQDSGVFRISRTGGTVGALTVNYTVATGPGQAASADYTPALTGSATIPTGESFVDITIVPVDDALFEGPETLTLTLFDSGSYDVGAAATATITIADNETNLPPSAVVLSNTVAAISAGASTANPTKMADLAVTDDGNGTNQLTVTGTDANFFQITGGALYLKAGTTLNFANKPSYSITVNVDDTTVGGAPDASVNFTLAVVQFVTPGSIIISEVNPAGSGTPTYGADWIEVTNRGTSDISIAGWKMDDNSNAFANAVALRGVTVIPAGRSAIFLEGTATGTTDATITTAFANAWFGSPTLPNGFLIGFYGGSGVGLGNGDSVNLFDASGARITGITFGTPTGGATVDNRAGLGSTTLPLPVVSTLSVAGTKGAFLSANGAETGSPGTINSAPKLTLPASPIIVEAAGPGGAPVVFAVSANDPEDGAISPVVSPASGTIFAPGNTTVSVSATDSDGLAATGSFVVQVRPLFSHPAAGQQPVSSLAAPLNLAANAIPAGGTFSGLGVTAAGVFDPGKVGPGIYTITYTVNGVSSTITIRVAAPPVITPVATLAPVLPFDGVGRYVNAGAGIDLANKSFTIEFWAQRAVAGAEQIVINEGLAGAGTGRALFIGFRSTDVFSFGFFDDNLNTAATFTDTAWHHWACTYDATSRERRIYRDGVQVANDLAGANFQGSGDFIIGANYGGTAQFYQGLLAEVRVWGTARNASQVAAKMFDSPAGNEAGLVAFWPLDDGQGTTAADFAIGHANPGVILGGGNWQTSTTSFGPLLLEIGASFTDPGATAVDGSNTPLTVTATSDVQANIAGFYGIVYSATDPATGITGTVRRSVGVSDRTAPSAPEVLSPANGSTVTSATTTIAGLAEPGSTVKLTITGTTNLNVTATADTNGQFSTTPLALGVGVYSVTAVAVDTAGNTSGALPATVFTRGSLPVPRDGIVVTRGGFVLDRATNAFVQADTLKNTTTAPISGPIYLVLDSLSANATLSAATGTTARLAPLNSAYVQVLGPTGSLAPGASLVTTLKFANPTRANITYNTRVLSGGDVAP
jgi:uncharacterized protein YjiK